MKKIIILCAFVLPIFMFACFAQRDKADIVELEGGDLWQGTWASDKTGVKGDFQIELQKEGTAISGRIKISGSPITKGGEVAGTINGDKIEFGLVKDKRGRLKYVGLIKGNTMKGTWEVPLILIKDRGTWQASRTE
ncbi:MAG: hypothetical protein WBC74_04660 [Candidatus Omnitrophota bacterium]